MDFPCNDEPDNGGGGSDFNIYQARGEIFSVLWVIFAAVVSIHVFIPGSVAYS